ncbi:MAG: hypothetical protein EZS28_016638 [Streblomastix strix]|uniref:Uncharacterized protein n=1 Tax=Streblomastix strix TaxID=222440 RepID=A0A5J4VYW4_9EUKA|nr:MAG: hypothetical protein EZS28_016638 [Streblomastix strix]
MQTELARVGYSIEQILYMSTAGGFSEEQDQEIDNALNQVSKFLNCLHHEGKDLYQSYFPPLPLFAKRSEEQIEVEGGNEEVEAQMINKGKGSNWNITDDVNWAKRSILNLYIDRS